MDHEVELTPEIIEANSNWVKEALEAANHCYPNEDDCSVKYPYLFQLAADIKHCQDNGLTEWEDRLHYAYGYKDCLGALHLRLRHADQLPDPRKPGPSESPIF